MIIVTAANGHLGEDIVTALLKRTGADKIVAAARVPGKLEHRKSTGIGIRRADYDDPDSLVEAFKGMDTLILIPSAVPIDQRMQQNRNVISAAKTSGISRILFLGLLDSRKDSALPYAKAVADTEKALAESGMQCTNLRMSLYMENFFEWPPFMVHDGKISLAAEDARISYIARSDLADATAVVALEQGHAGKNYELTGPAALSYDEVAASLSEVLGESVSYNRITPEEQYARVKELGAPEYIAQGSVGMAAVCREGAFDTVTTHLEELIGRAPEDFLSLIKRQKDKKHRVKLRD